MTTRRRFIWLMPASGAALLAACSESAPPPAAAPAAPASSAEYPVPAPAPAPAEAPAAAPAPAAPVAAGPMVEETEPTAVALSYVSDAARVDKTRHTKFADGQACGNCQLYQGAAAETGPCPLFPGKQVAARGWCASYVKRA